MQSVERHNLYLNVAEGAVYISSGAFVSAQTVIPALITRMGGTNVEVGLVGVLAYLGLFIPQLFAARYVQTQPWKKPWSITYGTGQRLVVLLMGFLVLLSGGLQTRDVLWGFLFLFLLNSVIGGVATPGWYDLFAKLTSPKKRGRLVGIRNSLGGAGAFLCGFILTWLLATFTFPVNYAIGFFIAFVLQISSIFLQRQLIESEPSPVLPARPLVPYLREIPSVLRSNPDFSRFLFASIFLIIAMVPSLFFTVYVLADFHADDSVVGQYTLAMMGIQVIGAFGIGWVSDRYGNKLALVCTSRCNAPREHVGPSGSVTGMVYAGVHLPWRHPWG